MSGRSTMAAVGIALLALSACQEAQKQTLVKPGSAADTAQQVMYGVRAPITESGVLRGELEADSMYVYNNQTHFDFYHGKVEFRTETGAVKGTMSGDHGRYNSQTQTLEGWGNVVVTTVDGNSLRSPHLIYDQLRDRITSDTTYQMVNGKDPVSGKGLETDSKLARYRCAADCKGTVSVSVPK